MKKLLSILAIFAISFQYARAQDIENKNDTISENNEVVKNKMDTIYSFPDVRAEFKGGNDALYNFFSSELTYPQMAVNNGVEHKFFVNFIICPDGSVCNIEIKGTRKLDKKQETKNYQESVALLEKEAIRVVQETNGKWDAGIKDGEKVNSYFTLPVTFVLRR